MGVPKFYRWLSERYPLINQIISNSAILPEFDNFYLDMNGIIHACTHPNDNHASNSLTLREMMLSIFRYVDRMVTEIVKPKRLLFLAIDGVAPRAKLNQQRARRFRAAQDRIESIEKAKARGEVVDEETLFDSNCITPGTEFMEMVSRHLKWFIRKKMKEDPLWRNLTIVYSGHDVPGEGEHKIMQYIRDLRCSPQYEPNLRHCMYGQDADLIMLGLASHEPHFALLREVINFNNNFGRKPARETVMRQTKDAQFQLLHISLLREYISIDFAHGLPPEISIDQERIIDDFIFLTFLVGNDFLPHLPTLDISEHAFDVLINAYRQLLIELPPNEVNNTGYLVNQGELYDLIRLERLFAIIGSQEQGILKSREEEKKKFGAKQRKFGTNLLTEEEEEAMEAAKEEAFNLALSRAMKGEDLEDDAKVILPIPPSSTTFVDGENVAEEEAGEGVDSLEKLAAAATTFARYEDSEDEEEVAIRRSHKEHDNDDEEEEEEEEEAVEAEKDFRGRYYYEKFHVIVNSSSPTPQSDLFLSTLMRHYLQGLTWCLAYYIKGCISWTWYYPYHYGPMLQDMCNLTTLSTSIAFTLGEPFTPFQQLLGCLPPASSILLPACYRWLMISTESPVLAFYPLTFEIDSDGKKNPWEAVVKLDFINELRLFEAEKAHCPAEKLTKHELQRNQFGHILQYEYNPSNLETYLSCNPEIGLPDIIACQSKINLLDYCLAPGHYFQSALIPGTVFPIAGYPCLAMLPIDHLTLDAIKLNIFGSDSRYKSIILAIDTSSTDAMARYAAEITKLTMLLGKNVYVNYPQVHEGIVVGITTAQEELILDQSIEEIGKNEGAAVKTKHLRYDDYYTKKWLASAEAERTNYLKGRKLPGTGGLDIGEIVIRLKVRPLQGLTRDPITGATKKVYAKTIEADIPIQMILWQPPAIDRRFEEQDAMSVEELFPLGTSVIAVTSQLIGCKGTVVGPHTADDATKSNKHKKHLANKKKTVDVEFEVPLPEPPFGYSIAHTVQDEYFSSKEICSLLGISPSVFGKLVGSLRIEPGRFDLGLNLKRNGMYQLLGYARKLDNPPTYNNHNHNNNNKSGPGNKKGSAPVRSVWLGNETVHIIGMDGGFDDESKMQKAIETETMYWEYSKHTAMLVGEYKSRFPMLFSALERLPHQAVYNPIELLGKQGEQILAQIMEWMKVQPFFTAPRTPFSTSSMSKEAMVAIERASDMITTRNKTQGCRKLVIKGIAINQVYSNIHRSSHDVALPFNPLEPKLGDRIVNLACPGVPFGFRGTVITIHHATKYVEVIFDEEFISGKSLQGSCSQFRGKLIAWTDLLLLKSDQRDHKPASIKKVVSSTTTVTTTAVEPATAVVEVKEVDTKKTKIPIESLFAKKSDSVVEGNKGDEEVDGDDVDDDASGASIDALLDEQKEYDFSGLVSDGTGWHNLSAAAGIGLKESKLRPEPLGFVQSAPWMSVVSNPKYNQQLSYVEPITFQPPPVPAYPATTTGPPSAPYQSNNEGKKVLLNKVASDRLVKHELGIPKNTHNATATHAQPHYTQPLHSQGQNPAHGQTQGQSQQGGEKKKKIAVESLFGHKNNSNNTTAVADAHNVSHHTATTSHTTNHAHDASTTTKAHALKSILMRPPAQSATAGVVVADGSTSGTTAATVHGHTAHAHIVTKTHALKSILMKPPAQAPTPAQAPAEPTVEQSETPAVEVVTVTTAVAEESTPVVVSVAVVASAASGDAATAPTTAPAAASVPLKELLANAKKSFQQHKQQPPPSSHSTSHVQHATTDTATHGHSHSIPATYASPHSSTAHATTTSSASSSSHLTNLLLNAKKQTTHTAAVAAVHATAHKPPHHVHSSPATVPTPVAQVVKVEDPKPVAVEATEAPKEDEAQAAAGEGEVQVEENKQEKEIVTLLKNAKRLSLHDQSHPHPSSHPTGTTHHSAAAHSTPATNSNTTAAPTQYKSVTSLLPSKVQILKRK